MFKHNTKKRRLKYVLLALSCTAAFSLSGIAAACKKADDETETDKTVSKEDTQLLKNGNFEFFNVPDDGIYLINTPSSWTRGGDSSYTQSGIIGTSRKDWAALTDKELADKLDYNNALDSSDADYKDNHVDYNGLKSSDLLYKDTYAAISNNGENDGEESDENTDKKEFIENPETHYNVREKDGKLVYTDGDGNEKPVYEDADESSKTYGDYFFDEEHKQPFSHVLMLHNYSTAHNGVAQNYSSVSIDLPANTAAEISLWVKTSYLKFSQGTDVSQDRGANIAVTHTVGSSALDDFAITGINTEKLIAGGANGVNGWLQYTVYVNACDFAASTVTLKLGLGESDLRGEGVKYPVEGYAFFDDVNVTKYVSLDDSEAYKADKATIENDGTGLTLSSDKSEKVFVADTLERNGKVIDERYSKSFKYSLDLASEKDYSPVSFSSATAGLTVDDDKYVSSLNNLGAGNLLGFTSATSVTGARLPKNFTSIDTADDMLAYVKAGYQFTAGDTGYYERLNGALSGAADLPNADAATDDNMLVMLSKRGAAYTSSFELSVEKESFTIISFWVKTSDMSGTAAATFVLKDVKDEDNSATLTLDTTGIQTDVGDEDDKKDIYDGWVQCFFFIKNETEDAKTLSLDFSLGQTTIKDTTIANYKAGWAALTNMQTLDVDEDTFAYTGGGDRTATLTLGEDDEKKTSVFDEVYGNQLHKIENDIANPSNYTGVNGSSSYVTNNGHISPSFDGENTNDYAGLINKEHFANYADKAWYGDLVKAFGVTSSDTDAVWNEIFGEKSVQPMIIVNKMRDGYVIETEADENNFKSLYVKNDDGEYVRVASDAEYDAEETYYSKLSVMNYGFIGGGQTVSADSFKTVSIRVRVSKGAVAYIYLADTSASKDVLEYKAPSYTYYYDEDGNVLKDKADKKASLEEQKANVLYTLRDDGLYEDENGKLYANVYNYKKLYKDSAAVYYDKNSNAVSFNRLVDGETYYKADGTEADCYLVTDDGSKIYELKNGRYYYVVKDVTPVEVTPFDKAYAIKGYSDISEAYVMKIDGDENNGWVTVNFILHAGSADKTYRLELWSGARNALSSGCNEGSAVIFDYSYSAVSDDALKGDYEKEIIKAYQTLLTSKGLLSGFATSEENINYYKDLVDKFIASGELAEADLSAYEILGNYKAHYYAYSLYDSANYKPNELYDYDIKDYAEMLAYLQIKDGDSYTVFADYSAVNQAVSLVNDDGDDGDDGSENSGGDRTTVWLLVSSILLVVALIIAMLSLLLRDMIKKARRSKTMGKNNYNHQKANRYIRKLHIKKEEFEEVEIPAEETGTAETETVESAEPAEEAETSEEENGDGNE